MIFRTSSARARSRKLLPLPNILPIYVGVVGKAVGAEQISQRLFVDSECCRRLFDDVSRNSWEKPSADEKEDLCRQRDLAGIRLGVGAMNDVIHRVELWGHVCETRMHKCIFRSDDFMSRHDGSL
jgi:hypothetical protein